MAEFLAEHVRIAAPIIEWGGLFFLLFVILSPFLLIRLPYFKPTRWWHVVGAYLVSFLLVIGAEFFLSKSFQWVVKNLLSTVDLISAYDQAIVKEWPLLLLSYPLLTFYCCHLLYESWSWRRFLISLLLAFLILGVLSFLAIYTVFYFLGQIGMDHF